MSDVETAAPASDEAAALSAARAGYARVKGGQSAPEASTPQQDSAASADVPSGGANGEPASKEKPEVATAAPSPAPDPVHEELAALKQKVRDLDAGGGASQQEIRRLHGEIGNLNRTIKTIEAAKSASASEETLAAALRKAEKVAEEYPEIGAPMLEALKAVASRQAAQPASEAPAPAAPSQPPVSASGYTPEQEVAIRALDEAHPDRHQVKGSPEFRAWFATQTPEYQTKVNTTWNAAVLSDCFTKFKAHAEGERARAAAKEAEAKRKQERLAAATSPQGVPGNPKPSEPTDRELARRGYERYAGKRL